ncbi:glycosyltransferase family 4 protein [Methanobacterium paludis]|uniref:Glycosyl transferase group 1 n=1 Tax=Methanobacterium paludis (strain DSM 25820 / JCM 18151 / SWAN1) TaxID=868131 RepID=F6D679_METPW|nr:glycosyltransferase family 1 protein [Methanobacterium paludis]AEG18292.1 glycosyl transferase group 1 [Methanobacterium paludis]
MKIDYINGPKTDKIFGRSKYQGEIFKRLDKVEFNIIEYKPLAEIIKKKFHLTPKQEKFTNDVIETKTQKDNKLISFIVNTGKKTLDKSDRYRYSQIIKKQIKKGFINHITSQEFAFVLNLVKLEKSIVTCYDLIPWIYEGDRSPLWRSIMDGLRVADCIITISEFSKEEIMKYLDYPEERIRIVYPAVDHSVYYENRNKDILSKIDVSEDEKVVLYVGSEMPRQNVPVLIKAFAELKKRFSDVKLVKIGESQSIKARENILNLINDLNLQEDVIFAGYVPEEDMPRWYNAADILVYPCAYAGFGLPPLEAMACGTPVITSNTTSLPEVVGDAGIMIDPQDYDLMADKMYEVLTNNNLKEELAKKGLEQSKRFNWEDSAKKTFKTYKMINLN